MKQVFTSLAFKAIYILLIFQKDVFGFQTPAPEVEMCTSDACLQFGTKFWNSINTEINPCDDFYEWACGNWKRNSYIPAEDEVLSFFHSRIAMVDEMGLRSLDNALSNRKNNPNLFTSHALNFGLDWYDECMDRNNIKSEGDRSIKKLLRDIMKFDWPLIDSNDFSAINITGNSNLEIFMGTYFRIARLGSFPLIKVVSDEDHNASNARILSFIQPQFLIEADSFRDPTKHDSDIQFFKNAVRYILTTMAGDRLKDERRTEFNLRLTEIYEIERWSSLYSTRVERMQTPVNIYNPMTLTLFENLSGGYFKWDKFLNELLASLNITERVNKNTLIVVQDIKYYRLLKKIFQSTPAHALLNFMGFKLLQTFIRYTDGELIKNFSNNEVLQNPSRFCYREVYSTMSFVFAPLFVNDYVPSQTKPVATLLVKDIKESFRDIIEEIEWLDSITRVKALEKLDDILDEVAFPDWIFNDTMVDWLHGFDQENPLVFEKGVYLENMVKYNNVLYRQNMRLAFKKVNRDLQWTIGPTVVNAVYMRLQNTIVIPAGILDLPFFEPTLPAYVNYAAVGSVIGHELTHGFDSEGSRFDNEGNLVNWWTRNTAQSFMSRVRCFSDQYSSIIDPDTGDRLNGIRTLDENIADNGAIRQAYNAYKKHAQRHSMAVIRHLMSLSYDQAFFYSYASLWCSLETTSYMKHVIRYDTHAPSKYRVNIVLRNFEKFAEAFNCPSYTNMNPTQEERCRVW